MIFNLNIPSERARFGLTENHKINEFGPSKLKLWSFKDVSVNYANLIMHVNLPQTSSFPSGSQDFQEQSKEDDQELV